MTVSEWEIVAVKYEKYFSEESPLNDSQICKYKQFSKPVTKYVVM